MLDVPGRVFISGIFTKRSQVGRNLRIASDAGLLSTQCWPELTFGNECNHEKNDEIYRRNRYNLTFAGGALWCLTVSVFPGFLITG